MTGHGGHRPGAGRKPPPDGQRGVSRTIRLYPATWALLERLAELTGDTQREVLEEALDRYASSLSREG